VKRPVLEADHSPPSSSGLRICGSIRVFSYMPSWREQGQLCLLYLCSYPKRRPWNEGDQSFPPNDEVKDEWSYNSTPSCAFLALMRKTLALPWNDIACKLKRTLFYVYSSSPISLTVLWERTRDKRLSLWRNSGVSCLSRETGGKEGVLVRES
jgi:hypothetical protein